MVHPLAESAYNAGWIVKVIFMELGLIAAALLCAVWFWRTENRPRPLLKLPHARRITTLARQVRVSALKDHRVAGDDAAGAISLIEGGLSFSLGSSETLDVAFSDLIACKEIPRLYDVEWWFYLQRDAQFQVVRVLFMHHAELIAVRRVIQNARPDLPLVHASDGLGYSARLAEQAWEGDVFVGQAVTLLPLAHYLMVLHNNTVLSQIQVQGVKRIIATERSASEGFVRLFGGTQTALFLLKDYAELAELLAERATCPLEIVRSQDRKLK
jgi:hypothetical protein